MHRDRREGKEDWQGSDVSPQQAALLPQTQAQEES